MKRTLFVLLAVAVLLTVVIAIPVSAKKPLTGVMDLFRVDVECPEGIFTWGGSVDFPDSTDNPSGEYGMAFIKTGTGKSEGHAPGGNVSFFAEIWTIYDRDSVPVDETGCPTNEGVLVRGTDRGVVTFNNLHEVTYRMNGDVAEAYEDFAMWEGRKVHMSGKVEFVPGIGLKAPGILRLN